MISRKTLDTLVERVITRLEEVGPAPVAKTGNFRYNNDGTSVQDTSSTVPTSSTAKTQMPATMHPQTIAAAVSPDEAAAKAAGAGANAPNARTTPPTQKKIKIDSIKKALDNQGYTTDANNAKRVTQSLGAWYDQLDPSDALVSTADELALRFAGEG